MVMMIIPVVVGINIGRLGETGRVIVISDRGFEIRFLADERDKRRVLQLPSDVLVPVVGMEGELRLDKVDDYGQDEGEVFNIVRRSMEIWLGVNIDGVIDLRERMISRKQSDLSLLERVVWERDWNKVGEVGEQVIELSDDLIKRVELADGRKVLEVGRARMWQFSSQFLGDYVLSSEDAGVVVVNASDRRGMALLATAMLEAEGAVVTDVESGDFYEGRCRVQVGEEEVDWFRSKWGCEVEVIAEGDWQVVLGRKWAERYGREVK